MKQHILLVVCALAIALFSVSVSQVSKGQEAGTTESVEETTEPQRMDLEEFSVLAKAVTLWETKRKEALETYVKKLNAVLIREKNRADLEFIQGVEQAIGRSETYHKGPCIVVDRLPSSIVSIQSELNTMKVRLNKAFIAAIEREQMLALSRKDTVGADRLVRFLAESFLPEDLRERSGDVIRIDRRLLLLVDAKMTWQDAYQWCRERNGDLASIENQEIQTRLYQAVQKQNRFGSRWIGGVKIMGSWQWTDGTPFKFTAWSGRPSGGRSETVMAFGYGPNGAWDDTNPLKVYSFTAQWTLY